LTHGVESAGERRRVDVAFAVPGRPVRMLAVTDFSGLTIYADKLYHLGLKRLAIDELRGETF
jgi:hypothetical protein